MQRMLEAGVHFGHRERYWNPKMAPYIYGVRYQLHIIDLGKAVPLLERAMHFVSEIAAKNGRVLWVGRKYIAQNIVSAEATRCDMPYVNQRWLGGMLTNYKTIRHSVKRLTHLEEFLENEAMLLGMTKKEILNLNREKDKLKCNLGGIQLMKGLPDALFVFDVGRERIAVKEANRLKIPVIGIVDTNRDPEGIDYIIPGNDDSVRAIELYASLLADTIIESRKQSVIGQVDVGHDVKRSSMKKVIVKKKRTSVKRVQTKIADQKEVDQEVDQKDDQKETGTASQVPSSKKRVDRNVKAKASVKPASKKAPAEQRVAEKKEATKKPVKKPSVAKKDEEKTVKKEKEVKKAKASPTSSKVKTKSEEKPVDGA